MSSYTVSKPFAASAILAIAVMLAAAISGCSSDAGTSQNQDSESLAANRGEHGRDGGEHSGEGRGEHDRDRGGDREGEESGTELALDERYDKVRNGARLILGFDTESNSFKGTVENTTEKTLERVRVEVHLSNGKELGPTKPDDLKPGEKRDVELIPTSKDFVGWTAHPEVGNEEHGHGEGHDGKRGEHDGKGEGEHKQKDKE